MRLIAEIYLLEGDKQAQSPSALLWTIPWENNSYIIPNYLEIDHKKKLGEKYIMNALRNIRIVLVDENSKNVLISSEYVKKIDELELEIDRKEVEDYISKINT